jgi:hypothetical protein
MKLAQIALAGSVCIIGASAQAARTVSGTLIVTDSSATTPTLPASALTLLDGATTNNTTLAGAPTDDRAYSLGTTGWGSYQMFPSNRSGSYGFYVDTNGYVMWSGYWQRPECTGEFMNMPLDQSPCRSHRFAPFWDDLFPVSGVSTITYGATSGQFWWVQWNDFALYGNRDARVTFRMTYFMDSQRVRFNYIRLEGTGADGSSATIGITSDKHQQRGGRQMAQFSHMQARLPTGNATAGTSLFAIEFDRDADRDGLTRGEEIDAGSNPGLFDTDGGGESDGSEVANARNPGSSADDVATDTDSDGLHDPDEAFFGTNPAVADTDGDTIEDNDELRVTLTDPTMADTDGDGFSDVEEDKNADGAIDDGESDPHNRMDLPSLDLADDNVQPHNTTIQRDAAGNIHVLAGEYNDYTSILYWVIKPDGTVGIPQTHLKTFYHAYRPAFAIDGDTIHVIYMATMEQPNNGGNDGHLGYLRFSIAGHPLDGSPLTTAYELNAQIDIGFVPRHPSMALDGDGNVTIVAEDLNGNQGDSQGGGSAVRYVEIDSTGAVMSLATLAEYPWSTGDGGGNGLGGPGSAGFGVHKNHSPRIVSGPDGARHIVWVAQTAPYYQLSPYEEYPTGMYYVRIDGGVMTPPAHIGHGRIERLDVAMTGDLLYVATSNGYDTDDTFFMSQGARLAVIDTAELTFVPRVGDLFGVEHAVASSSFITPFRSVYNTLGSFQDMGITIDANGNALLAFSSDWNDDFRLVAATVEGELIGDALSLVSGGRGDSLYNRHKKAIRLPNGDIVAALQEWNTSDLRFMVLPSATLPSPAPVTPNRSPQFTAAATDTVVAVGVEYSFSYAATDDATSAANLDWYLLAGSSTATLSSSGQLAWTPTSADAGDWLFGVGVCDDDAQRRCTESYFVITVMPGLDNYPPVINGIPSTTAIAGSVYEYQASVNDPDLPSDSHTYELLQPRTPPGDMQLSTDGLFHWTPSSSDLGGHAIVIRVTDSANLSSEQAFTITVYTDLANGQATVVVQDGGGCQAASGTGLGLVLAALALLWRRRRSWAAGAALGALVLASAPAQAARTPVGDVLMTDSSATTPTLSAEALTLLVGANGDNQTLTDTPTDDTAYGMNPSTWGGSQYRFFPSNRPDGNSFYIDTNGYAVWSGYRQRNECSGEFMNVSTDVTPCRSHRFAPFWDDLYPVEGVSTITYGGTNGQFWYVQWNEFALYDHRDTRLTFRMTYFVGTQHIRFNYIKLEGTGADGSGATIGIHSDRQQNRTGGRRSIIWSQNAARLPTGTASSGSSLFAIEFDRDADRDGLTSGEEVAAGSNPGSLDSDGGGETDGSEVAAGRDPATSGDDVTADTDSDGLVDPDEAYWGGNPAVADTDGDTIEDGDEVRVTLTDPALADTDGDGFDDQEEDISMDGAVDQNESNPRNPDDLPGLSIAMDGVEPHNAQLAMDAAGNVHIVASDTNTNTGVLYWLMRPDGTVGISQSIMKTMRRVYRPSIALEGNIVHVTYMSTTTRPSSGGSDGMLGYMRFSIAGHPLDGSPLSMDNLEFNGPVEIGFIPRHPDMALGPDGTLHLVAEDLGNNEGDGSGGASYVRYVSFDQDGQVISSAALAYYPWESGSGGSNEESGPGSAHYGVHKNHSVRIVAGPGGAMHIVWVAQTAPYYQYSTYAAYPTGMFYVRIADGLMTPPAYIGHGRIERVDVAMRGDNLYVATSNGYDDYETFYQTQGLRLAVIDTANLVVVPRVGDLFGVEWALSASSFVTPFRTVHASSGPFQGMGVTVDSNGNALLSTSSNWDDTYTLVAASAAGELIGSALTLSSAEREDSNYRRHKLALRTSNGDVVAALQEWTTDDMRYVRVPAARLPSPVAAVPNRAPMFTSAPMSATIPVGQLYSFAFAATDDATTAPNLTWYLLAGHETATFSGTGALAWTPRAADAGDWLFGVAVCDSAAEQRCTEHYFVLTVMPGLDDYPPVINGIPSTSAVAGRQYAYQASVADPDLPNDTHTFALLQPRTPPGDMRLATDGLFTWTPSASDIGGHAIVIRVTDSSGQSSDQAFTITVFTDVADGQPAVTIDGGSGCSAQGSGAWAVLLAGALLVVRRRRMQP